MRTKEVKINKTVCKMKVNNPREFYLRLNNGVVNEYSWSDGNTIIINVN